MAERFSYTRQFGLNAGQLLSQLNTFARSSAVHVIIHDWAPDAFLAFASDSDRERGKRYELRQNVDEFLRTLKSHNERKRVHVLASRSSTRSAPRRLAPRSVVSTSANGRIAEIHADYWRWAETFFGDVLEIEIDLDAEYEATDRNERIHEKPRAIWTPGEGWTER